MDECAVVPAPFSLPSYPSQNDNASLISHISSIRDMSDSSTSRFAALFESALLDYENQTGTSLAEHPLTQQLENCDSVESITATLHEKARAFSEFRGSDGRMMRSLKSTVSVLYTLSTSSTLGEAVALVLLRAMMSIPRP
jgi:hypothetical protein